MCINMNGEKANCTNNINESNDVNSNVFSEIDVINFDNIAIVPLEKNVTSNVVNMANICYNIENMNVNGMTCNDSRESIVEIVYENSNMNIRNIEITNDNFPETKTISTCSDIPLDIACIEENVENNSNEQKIVPTRVLKTSNKTTLKIGCLNVRSLVNKIEQIQTLAADFDILIINETWLDITIKDNEVAIQGTNILRKDRNRQGGGVCMYIKNNIRFKEIQLDSDIESLWIKITEKKNSLIVGTIYRPPDARNCYYDKILDEIQSIERNTNDLIILGDLNYNYLDNLNMKPITEIESMFELTQIVRSPTRVTLRSSTLLDVILTGSPEKFTNTSVIPISISDHYCISTEYMLTSKLTNESHKIIMYRDYKTFNCDQFLTDLALNDDIVNTEFDNNDLQQIWQKFKNAFIQISNCHAPIKSRRLKDRYNPWMSREIIDLMYERDRKKQQAVKLKSSEKWEQYTQLRNEINTKIRKAKKKYYNDELDRCQGNSKQIWKFIDKITNKTNHVNPPKELTANNFNDYFSQIGQQVISRIKKTSNDIPWKGPKAPTKFKFNIIENDTIIKTISKLDKDSNTDVLGFDAKLLNLSNAIITPILCKMFNASILSCIMPEDWKLARVSPVYKGKGDKKDKGNYRPISVICHIGKVFEIQVHNQLLQYFQENNYINIDQSAYLKYHNTQTALHRVTDDWIDNMCHKLFTGICSLDIKKCFDTIDHEILLRKLEYYGLHNNELSWFKSYLYNRSQIVRCNGKTSDVKTVNIGVPQGSVLGPLLFLIFVNDISQHIYTGTTSLYADDTLIYCDGKNVVDVNTKLQKCIDDVSKWYVGNNIVINASKSCTMLVKPKLNRDNEMFTVNINEEELENVHTLTYLGVDIDDCMSWNDQIKKTCKNLACKVSKLSRLAKTVPDEILLKLYNSGIQPCIDYAITVWGSTTMSNVNKVQRLQNFAARVIKRNFDFVNTRGIELVKQLGWMNVKQRFLYFQNLTIFKCIHGLAPTHLVNNVTMEIEISNIRTRKHPMNLHVPLPLNETHKRMLFYRGAKSWIQLPSDIKDCYDMRIFKQKLKCYIKNHSL